MTRLASLTAAVASAGPRLSAQTPAQARRLLMYVGTYSAPSADGPPGSHGRGIHIFEVDRTSGALTPVGVHEHGTSPSALVFNAAGTRVYTTNASDVVDNGTSGTVSALAVDGASGQLSLLNTVRSGGLGPTDVHLHPAGRHVLVANYGGGSVAVLPVLPDGRLGQATDVKKTTGTLGPTRATSAPPGSFAFSGHDAPHPHMIQADAAGRLRAGTRPRPGSDFRLAVRRGQRAAHGERPRLGRHCRRATARATSPSTRTSAGCTRCRRKVRRWCSSTTTPRAGGSRRGRRCRSLPPGMRAAISRRHPCSSDGRFVYAANRLHETIACFAVGTDGTLTFVDEAWTRGSYPAQLRARPLGTLLYVCNQRADNLTTFRVDRATGRLTFTGQYTPVGSPSAIAFLG